MESNAIEWLIGVPLGLIALALSVWYLQYKRERSENRMRRMLRRMGVDPAVAGDADHEALFRAARSRCRACQAEDVCERWLAGSYREENLFCPNALTFRALAAEHRRLLSIYD